LGLVGGARPPPSFWGVAPPPTPLLGGVFSLCPHQNPGQSKGLRGPGTRWVPLALPTLT
jgi:hypothetical protein